MGIFKDKTGTLSTTKVMNIVFFIMAITTFLLGIIGSAILNFKIDQNLYLFVAGLCGGSFLQYSYGKKINDNGSTEKNNG